MAKQKNVRYGQDSIVRCEWPTTRQDPEEFTVQRLLATDFAASNLQCALMANLDDLKKLTKGCKEPTQTALKNIVKDFQKALREYQKDSTDDSIGQHCQVTVIPRADVGKEKAKEESQEQRMHENLQKLEKLADPDGHFQREWEKDQNLQMARDHFMVLLRAAHERAEKAARKTQLKLVRKGKGKEG